MKTLILTLLLSSVSQATNFATISELQANLVKTVYTDQKFCPEDCLQVDGFDLDSVDLVKQDDGSYVLQANPDKKAKKDADKKAKDDADAAKKQQAQATLQSIKNLSGKSLSQADQKAAIEALVKLFSDSDSNIADALLKLSTTK